MEANGKVGRWERMKSDVSSQSQVLHATQVSATSVTGKAVTLPDPQTTMLSDKYWWRTAKDICINNDQKGAHDKDPIRNDRQQKRQRNPRQAMEAKEHKQRY